MESIFGSWLHDLQSFIHQLSLRRLAKPIAYQTILFSDDFHQHPLAPTPVEPVADDPLPGAKVQLALGNCRFMWASALSSPTLWR